MPWDLATIVGKMVMNFDPCVMILSSCHVFFFVYFYFSGLNRSNVGLDVRQKDDPQLC